MHSYLNGIEFLVSMKSFDFVKLLRKRNWNDSNRLDNYFSSTLPPPFSKVFHENRVNTCLAVAKKGVVSYSIIKGSCFKKEKKFGTYGKLNFERFNFKIIHGWPLTTNRDDSMQLSSEIARSNPWFGRSQRKQACFFSAIDPNYFHATR